MFPNQTQSTVENIESYHAVFAKSMSEIIMAIATKNKDSYEALLRYNIWYAYSIWRCETDPLLAPETINAELQKMKLDKLPLMELVVIMTFYQSKAGLKPVQERDQRAKLFERFLNENEVKR